MGKIIKIVTGWQCPICNTVYSPLVSCCTCATETKDNIETNNCKSAAWIIWGGWKGNHDQRIEDAKCSNCGYIHPTVFNSTSNLGKHCPACACEMSISEQG